MAFRTSQHGVWGVYGKVLTSRFVPGARTWFLTDDTSARDTNVCPGTIIGVQKFDFLSSSNLELFWLELVKLLVVTKQHALNMNAYLEIVTFQFCHGNLWQNLAFIIANYSHKMFERLNSSNFELEKNCEFLNPNSNLHTYRHHPGLQEYSNIDILYIKLISIDSQTSW